MKRYITIYIFVICLLAGLSNRLLGQVYTPAEMPNVNIENRSRYVSDPAGLLTPQTREQADKMLWDLRQQTTVEAVVALPPSIGDESIEDWSLQLFELWGIGKKDKDNGLLLVISPESRAARILVGYGMEGVFSTIVCAHVIDDDVIPNMKDDNINAAVLDAVSSICKIASDPTVADEIRSSEKENYSGAGIKTLDSSVFKTFILWVAGLMFLVALILFVRNYFAFRRLDRYHRSLEWRKTILIFTILTVCSLGSGLIFLLLAVWCYRHARTGKHICKECGNKMHRLPEDKDNDHLSLSQDFEEQIKTVDYDVWECDKCGATERYAYPEYQKKYTKCPRCGTIAMTVSEDRTVIPATYSHSGTGERISECKFCHYRTKKDFTIPKKERPIVIIPPGGGGGRGFGGGGGFGGGFGGGMTGGGGASGRW